MKWLLFLILIFAENLSAQTNMERGFAMLEDQQFDEAENYFYTLQSTESDNLTAKICYGRALGLGGNHTDALNLFISLAETHPYNEEVQLNLAEAQLWNKNYDAAIKVYSEILKNEKTHFVANFGFANAHAGKSVNAVALDYIDRALSIKPGDEQALNSKKYILLATAYQAYKNGSYSNSRKNIEKVISIDPQSQEATKILNLISDKTKAILMTKYGQSYDQEKNRSEFQQYYLGFNYREKHKIGVDVNLLKTSNSLTTGEGQQRVIFINDKYLLNAKTQLNFGIGMSENIGESKLSQNHLMGKLGVENFWGERLYTHLNYSTEVHNYTPTLISKNILMHHFGFAFNYMFLKRLGLYTNLMHSRFTSINQRNLVFNSLHYKLFDEPLLKVGINHSAFTYDNDQAEFYFSPSRFQAFEAFFLLEVDVDKNPIYYKLEFGWGSQKIERSEFQTTGRVEASLGYNLKNGLRLSFNYLHSNTAQVTAIGAYSYKRIYAKLSYVFNEKEKMFTDSFDSQDNLNYIKGKS